MDKFDGFCGIIDVGRVRSASSINLPSYVPLSRNLSGSFTLPILSCGGIDDTFS